MSPLSIILLSLVKNKVVWSESGEKSAQIKQCLQAKTNSWLDLDVRDNRWTLLLITDSILAWSNSLKLKHFNDDLFQLLSPDVNWWPGVVWIIVMFLSDSHSDGTHSLQSIHWLSFWRHPFTAEHPLTLILTAPIHCSASIAEQVMHFSKSDEDTNSSTSWMTFLSLLWLSFWKGAGEKGVKVELNKPSEPS